MELGAGAGTVVSTIASYAACTDRACTFPASASVGFRGESGGGGGSGGGSGGGVRWEVQTNALRASRSQPYY